MDISVDATALGRGSTARTAEAPLKVRTQARLGELQGDVDCQISPQSPLVSSTLEQNGNNAHGQLGIGSSSEHVSLQPLGSARCWASMSVGDGHAAGVTCAGEVFTWGLNDCAQLGGAAGPSLPCSSPRRMDLLLGWNVRGVACGGAHTVAFTAQDVITWGRNDRGQCGHGDRAETDWVKPRSIKVLHDLMISQVVCGRAHTLCVTGTSQVFGWGSNSHGQLGLGDVIDRRTPTMVEGLWALPVLQLAAGDRHSAALTTNGFLFAWGDNRRGQLGLPAASDVAAARLLGEAAEARAGPGSSRLSREGARGGEEGDEGMRAQLAPADSASSAASSTGPLPAIPHPPARRLARRVNQRFLTAMLDMGICREHAELALQETGNVGVEVAAEWLFSVPPDVLDSHLAAEPGTPQEELGALPGEAERVLVPRRVALQGVRAVACGGAHTAAATDEEVFAWGLGTSGQLGLGGGVLSTHVPLEIAALAGRRVLRLAAGRAHTLFLAADGSVLGCGERAALAGAVAAAAAAAASEEAGIQEERISALGAAAISAALSSIGDASPAAPASPGALLRAGVFEPAALDLFRSPASRAGAALKSHPVHRGGGSGPAGLPAVHAPGHAAGLPAVHAPGHAAWPHGLSHLGPGSGRDDGEEERPKSPPPAREVRVSAVVAGQGCSAFLTRGGGDDAGERPSTRLWERLAAAVGAARRAPPDEAEARVRPISVAVERIFGSAAALCAAFGLKDRVGLDHALLESVSCALHELEPPPSAGEVDGGDGRVRDGGAASARGGATSARGGPPTSGRGVAPAQPPPASALPGPPSARAEMAPSVPARAAANCWVFVGLRKGMETLLNDLEHNVRLLGTPERAQVLLAALQSTLLGDSRCSAALVPRLCAVVLGAPGSARHLLVKWWAEYPGELLERRVVRPLQKYLTDELYTTKKLTVSVMNVIKVLAKVEEANQLGRALPPDAFYNELISEKLDVLDHYVAWRQTHDMPAHAPGADGPFSFCSYPFLLNPRAKSKLLHTEARIQMDQTVAACRAEAAGAGEAHGAAPGDDRVVPAKARPPARRARTLPDRAEAPPRPGSSARSSGGGGPRRERSQGGLRWLFNSLRAGDSGSSASSAAPGASASSSPAPTPPGSAPGSARGLGAGSPRAGDDERRLIGRQASDGCSAIWKQGSLNLPPPDESGFPATHPDMCIVRVRRNHLVRDALDEIARQKAKDLFKPLRVHFIGEDGIDAGGVKKEFFQLLVAEVLSPDYGMLCYQPESRTYWFCPVTLEAESSFLLLGLVLGLAIYNGVLLDFPLPLALYRKILGQEVGLRDLEDMQPALGKSLRALLTWEGEGRVEDVFCQSFVVDVPSFGSVTSASLKPDGEALPVTDENRREFVDLYVDFWLNRSIHVQFEAFAKGFLMLCGGPALQLFSATELERLVCGNPFLDFDALQRAARYEGGFHPEHRVVQWLWQVVGQFNAEEKRLFLKFFTGSDRAPIGGLANLRCIVQRDGADSNKLPTSHTCFNTLLLPSYRSREKLADRLKLAILNSEGFGLE